MARFVPSLPTYRRQGWGKALLFRIVFILVGIYAFVFLTQSLILYSLQYRSNSMTPTLQSGDVVLVTPFLYGRRSLFSNESYLDFAGPSRGDVVVLDPPYVPNRGFFLNFLNRTVEIITFGHRHAFSNDEDERNWMFEPVIRRVIGLPGDTITYSDGSYSIRPKGAQNFISEHALFRRTYQIAKPEINPQGSWPVSVTVPDGQLFVAADNRSQGLDSRQWGTIGKERLKGHVFLKTWPIHKVGVLP